MTEEKPKRKPRAKKQPEVVDVKPVAQEKPQALTVKEIQALPKAERKAALELHAKIGDDPKWAKVMLNVSKP